MLPDSSRDSAGGESREHPEMLETKSISFFSSLQRGASLQQALCVHACLHSFPARCL